ncbi:hypothetical protein HF519_24835, partial [Pseudonocardia bannensis]|nr:hypothetical protein [Pseudonocardia bannensis]
MAKTARETFRVPAGDLDLCALDPRARPIGPKDKATAEAEMIDLGARLDARQEALYAEAVWGGRRSVLLVLQGMDTSGNLRDVLAARAAGDGGASLAFEVFIHRLAREAAAMTVAAG